MRYPDAWTSLRAVLAPAFPTFDPETSPHDVHIRRATIGDLGALVDLENAAFAIDRMSVRQWRHHLESLSVEILVAIRERGVVGAAIVFFRRGSAVARLYSVAVAASERGRGIGDDLLTASEHAATRRGSRAMRLEVRSDNAGAQRLYERHAFRRIGTRVGYYADGHCALRYEKSLLSVLRSVT